MDLIICTVRMYVFMYVCTYVRIYVQLRESRVPQYGDTILVML